MTRRAAAPPLDAKIADLRRTRRNITKKVADCRAGRCRLNPTGRC